MGLKSFQKLRERRERAEARQLNNEPSRCRAADPGDNSLQVNYSELPSHTVSSLPLDVLL